MILVLLVAGATGLTACGSSNDRAGEGTQPPPTATTGPPATTSSGLGDKAAVKVSGAASGTFDTVTRCNLGDEHGMLFISLGGTLDGTPTELAVDQTRFTPDAYVYPQANPPTDGSQLSSDISFTGTTTDKRRWVLPAYGATGGGGTGTIDLVQKSDRTIDVTIDATYGTTDGSAPVKVAGTISCKPPG